MRRGSVGELKARRVNRSRARKANSRVFAGPDSGKQATRRGMTAGAWLKHLRSAGRVISTSLQKAGSERKSLLAFLVVRTPPGPAADGIDAVPQKRPEPPAFLRHTICLCLADAAALQKNDAHRAALFRAVTGQGTKAASQEWRVQD